MKVKYIDQFLFTSATYTISSSRGQEVLLEVDYAHGSYLIHKHESFEVEFVNEIETIARDLIERKHNVNIAEKV